MGRSFGPPEGGYPMFFDHLTFAGIAIVSLYGLLPLLFGKELLRVEEEETECPKTSTDCGSSRLANPVFAADDA